MTIETGVGAILSASHLDRLSGRTHGHSWEIVVWHQCQSENDAVMLQNHLANLLKVWDHTILPPELTRAEDLAAAIKKLSPPSCVEVEIRRPLERLFVRVRD
jgi:6-pyruvoyl-tetrahydropterin synthase